MPLIAIGFGVLGASIASTVGVSLLTGWAIGSLIGGLFAPGTNTTVSGPRLENTAPAVSNIIGSPIQIPYGTVRVPGSIIWSNTITERTIKDVQKSGGSGRSSKQTTITYEYYLDFAVAICGGPITGIKKIWANNKVIYDQGGSVKSEPWLVYNLYLGTESQIADPYITDILGSEAPGHRGLAYIVFKQFKLEEYGNRAPQSIEFEVVASGSSAGTSTTLLRDRDIWYGSAGQNQESTRPIVIDDGTTRTITFGSADDTSCFGRVFYSSALVPNQFELYKTPSSLINTVPAGWGDTLKASHHIVGLNRDNKLVTFHFRVADTYDGDGNTMISLFDLDGTLLETRDNYWHHSGSFLFFNAKSFMLDRWWVEWDTEAGYQHYKFCDGGTAYNTFFPGVNNNYFTVTVQDSGSNITGSLPDYRIKTRRYDTGGSYNMTVGVANNEDNWEYKRIIHSSKEDLVGEPNASQWLYVFDENSFYDYDPPELPTTAKLAVVPWIYIDVTNLPPVNLNPPCGSTVQKFNKILGIQCPFYAYEIIGSGVWTFHGAYVDPTDTERPNTRVLIAVFTPTGQTTPTKYFQSDFTTGSAYYNALYNTGIGCININNKNKFYVYGENYKIYTFNFSSGVWSQNSYTPSTQLEGATHMVHLGNKQFLLHGDGHDTAWTISAELINLEQVTSSNPTLSSIVEDIADRSGFNPSKLDVSQLTSIYVPGYTIRDRETARQSIEDVIYPFFVDPVASEWQLKFKRRGANTTPIAIPYNDLGCTTSDYEEPYSLVLPEENTLPKEIDFRYLGKLNNYQTSHQRAVRHSKATNAEDKSTLNTEVVLSDTYAKEAAIKFLENIWINSRRITIKLSKKYNYLEPTDIIQLYTNTGLLILARIVEMNNDYNIIEVNAELEYFETYDNYTDYSEFSAGYDSSDLQKIPIIATMYFKALDSYPIYDIFNESRDVRQYSYIYTGATSPFSSWPGGQVFFSSNDVDYTAADYYPVRYISGVIDPSTSLSIISNYKLIDVMSTIVVNFNTDPELVTITKEQLLAGGLNTFAIDTQNGIEIISAQTVSNVDTKYTFTNLLRGRYNTQTRIGNHYNADNNAAVTLINANTMRPSEMPYGIYDVTYYYKGLTDGANLDLVPSKSQYYTADWNKTVKCDIVNINESAGDIIIDWVPISNFNTNTLHSPGIDYKYHRIEILDKNSVVVRTIDDLTTDTYTYNAADIATDGLTTLDIIQFRIYRKSYMRAYSVGYTQSMYLPNTLKETLSACTATDPQLLYTFNEQLNGNTEFADLMGTATNTDLILHRGPALTKKYKGLTKYTRKQGAFEFGTNSQWRTSSTTAGSSGTNYTFMLLVKPTKVTTGTSNKFLRRTTEGAYGSRGYTFSYQWGGVVLFQAETFTTPYYEYYEGDTLLIIVTTSNSPAPITENVYINGELVGSGTKYSFVRSWGGDFRFGDTDDTSYMGSSKAEIDTFAYWNYTLSAAEVTAIWNAYNDTGGFKL